MDFFNLDLSTIWDDSKRIFFPEVDFADPLQQEAGLAYAGDAGQAAADRADQPMLGSFTSQIPQWVWPVGLGLLALVVVRPLLK